MLRLFFVQMKAPAEERAATPRRAVRARCRRGAHEMPMAAAALGGEFWSTPMEFLRFCRGPLMARRDVGDDDGEA